YNNLYLRNYSRHSANSKHWIFFRKILLQPKTVPHTGKPHFQLKAISPYTTQSRTAVRTTINDKTVKKYHNFSRWLLPYQDALTA
ncbi:hypothetical protein, partial [Endozoicomonas sp. SESOKO1]|uniref:hypothetical protein n=1 Tax=Endozoicomonas sp. SESOKO1 TaxID=2828742 RepID=UPI002147C868